MNKLSLRITQTGDTLVEVMLAMAIVASVLGAAYGTASRSLRTGRAAQERTEALRHVESQIEQLKSLAKVGTPFAQTTPFCLNTTNAVRPITNPECTRDQLYRLSINYSAAADDTFTVKASWERAGVSNTNPDTVEIAYKLHPGLK